MPPFRLFGPDHLVALGLALATAWTLAVLVRRRPETALPVRTGLAAALALVLVTELAAKTTAGTLQVWDVLPLHLCDLAVFLALAGLGTLRPLPCELLWFWACSGTVLAMVTPDVAVGFPSRRFLSYFLMHGLVVAAAVVLVPGLRVRPRLGAPARVWRWTLGYAALVAVVDFAFDQNFLFLRHKPEADTLLDVFGPWPWYLVVAAVLAYGLFWALDRPFRRGAAG